MATTEANPSTEPEAHENVKRCGGTCGRSLPRTEFHRRSRSPDGLMAKCKQCNYRSARSWKKGNPDRMREYRIVNPRPFLNRELRRRYGIGIDDYEARLEAQGGRCAICRMAPTAKRRLDVDHDHETGEIRGLLCMRCNIALGQIDHDPARARALAGYLESRSL